MERQAKLAKEAAQEARAASRTRALQARALELSSILKTALTNNKPTALDFEELKRAAAIINFDDRGLSRPLAAPQLSDYHTQGQTLLERIIPALQAGYEARKEHALLKYQEALAEHAKEEKRRQNELASLREAHENEIAKSNAETAAWNASIDAFRAAYEAAEPDAVVRYFTEVLKRDQLPEGVPRLAKIAFVPESRQLVIERDVPSQAIQPSESAYKYIKKTDSIEAVKRPVTQAKAAYADMIAQIALRTLHVVANSDTCGVVQTLVLNCFVDAINVSTGNRVHPCLISVSVSKDDLSRLALANVDPVACLKGLHAQVSRSAHELEPVRPLVDFNMVDKRFVKEQDVLSELDSRPNLAELTPSEFESLMTNLFEKMGLETRLTQASRDGGVDCVAWDMRPVIGGKVVIQAKRYKHTVGVSAVRDLFGTVHNEGAAKGILVTTSGYGKSAYEFVVNKPLELITGSNLLYLLKEHTGIDAKIEFPDEWQDPVPDIGS